LGRRVPEEIIKNNLEYINTRKQKLNEYEKDIQVNFLRGFGMDAKSIAGQYLLLNNTDEARKWFTESARYYLESKKINDNLEGRSFEYSSGLSMIVSASLSGDRNLKNEVAESILKRKPYTNPPGLFLKFQVIVSNLILGNVNIDEELQELKTLENKYSKKTGGFYTGYTDALMALRTKDSENLKKSVEDILSRFSKSRMSRDYPYEFEIAMILMLAKDRGMDIDPERDIDKKYHKYIPMGLLKT